jgi:hypothetical protein
MPDATPDPLIEQLLAKRADVAANPALDSVENKRDGVRAKKLAKIDAELAALGHKAGGK